MNAAISRCLRPGLPASLIVAAVATLALMVMPSTATAGVQGWNDGGGGTSPKLSDLAPAMRGEEAYLERYSFSTDLDNGGHIGFDFTISNLGWGDAKGGASVRVKWPGKGKHEFNEKKSKGDWNHSKSTLFLDIANTTVTAPDASEIQLVHNGDFKVDITFHNRIPMWQPGNGEIDTGDGFYRFHLIAPRADVTGTVTIDGKTYEVEGTRSGYGEHVSTNIAPYEMGKRFSRFRHYNGDVFVMWREIELASDYGGKSLTWVVVGYKDEIVFSDADADIKFARNRKDSKSGYTFPMALQIDGEDGDDSIKLVLKGRRFKRKDLLESYGSAAKAVASTVAEPYQFDVQCKYKMRMDIQGATATVSGSGHYVMDYINK